MMTAFRMRCAILLVFVLVQPGPFTAQEPERSAGAPQGGGAASGDAAPQGGADQQPTFRGGIDFVRVDVIVTDRQSQPVTDLTAADFEVLENGQPQTIEQFQLIRVDGRPVPGEQPPRAIRNVMDEEVEAMGEDVRMFALFLDDYHVRDVNAMSIRAPLIRFVETQLQPQDMVAVMYPMTPLSDVLFTRDHAAVVRAIQRFEGRKYDYTPRFQQEYEYWRYPSETVERIRNDVVMGALRSLASRMGGLRDGRKSIVFVSEGFTVMLPPQMRRADASQPANSPRQTGAGSQDTEIVAEWFSAADVQSRLRDVFAAANRSNTSIYAIDPRGMAAFEFDINEASGGSFQSDRRALQMTQDTLRVLAEETDGRAIVNQNNVAEGLAQVVRDSSAYYLLGYTTQAPSDGRFNDIRVRVARRNVQVRARKGFWAVTEADVIRATTAPAPEIRTPVQAALATIAPGVQAARYVQTWIGTERGDNGRTRVTLVWEPLPPSPGSGREQPGRLSVLAAAGNGDVVFRGRAPEADAGAAAAGRDGASPAVTGPQRLAFDAPPGAVELRLTIEAAGGGTLDNEVRTIEVPDLTAPEAVSTPRVYRTRNAREFQAIAADAAAIPVAVRTFSRAERLLIRFDVYGAGTDGTDPTAVLLNRAGQQMAEIPVARAVAGGTHQVDLGLNTIPAGEYLVEITLPGNAEAHLIPLRVGS